MRVLSSKSNEQLSEAAIEGIYKLCLQNSLLSDLFKLLNIEEEDEEEEDEDDNDNHVNNTIIRIKSIVEVLILLINSGIDRFTTINKPVMCSDEMMTQLCEIIESEMFEDKIITPLLELLKSLFRITTNIEKFIEHDGTEHLETLLKLYSKKDNHPNLDLVKILLSQVEKQSA